MLAAPTPHVIPNAAAPLSREHDSGDAGAAELHRVVPDPAAPATVRGGNADRDGGPSTAEMHHIITPGTAAPAAGRNGRQTQTHHTEHNHTDTGRPHPRR